MKLIYNRINEDPHF